MQAILPVGDMPDDVFASYASLVTAFRQVRFPTRLPPGLRPQSDAHQFMSCGFKQHIRLLGLFTDTAAFAYSR